MSVKKTINISNIFCEHKKSPSTGTLINNVLTGTLWGSQKG